MSLTDAIALRGGAATATVNFDNEQREFIEFADGGDADWSYVGRSETNGYAGVYADQTTSIWETDVFAPDAEIAQVWWQPPVTG